MRIFAMLTLLCVALPASAGGLIGVTTGGLLPLASGSTLVAPSLENSACAACATVPPLRPALAAMAPIPMPTVVELLGEPRWLEPADLAMLEAQRASRCAGVPNECYASPAGGLRFDLAAP